MTFHAQCHTDKFPPLTISESTFVDNPPGSKLPKLSLTRLQNISINPIELNRLPPQPSLSLLTLEDFMQCVSVTKTEDDRRKKIKDQERERILMDIKRMLILPPRPGCLKIPLLHI